MKDFKKQVRSHLWMVSFTIILVCSFFNQGISQTDNIPGITIQPSYSTKNIQVLHHSYLQPFEKDSRERNRSIMLPSLTSMNQEYPLFCRLEDKINAGNKLLCLFRLCSLSYVNFLEQKGDHQRLMLEQIR